MKTRTWWLIIFLLIILALGAFFWFRSPASKSVKKDLVKHLVPTMGVTSMNITDIDKERIKIKMKVSLKNPLPVNINATGFTYQIFIDSVKIIQNDYGKPIRIRSEDSTTIEMPVVLLASPLKNVLEYFDKNKIDSADYSITAKYNVNVPIAGQRNFALHFSRRLPAFRLPKVKVEHVDLHGLRLKKKGCDMEVRVTNPNLFPIKIKDAVFSFGIGNQDLELEGRLQDVVAIPAKGSEVVSMHADFKKGKVLKVGWEILTKKNSTPYNYTLNFKLITDNIMLDKSNMAMNMNGTMGELIEAGKKAK